MLKLKHGDFLNNVGIILLPITAAGIITGSIGVILVKKYPNISKVFSKQLSTIACNFYRVNDNLVLVGMPLDHLGKFSYDYFDDGIKIVNKFASYEKMDIHFNKLDNRYGNAEILRKIIEVNTTDNTVTEWEK